MEIEPDVTDFGSALSSVEDLILHLTQSAHDRVKEGEKATSAGDSKAVIVLKDWEAETSHTIQALEAVKNFLDCSRLIAGMQRGQGGVTLFHHQ